MQSKILFYVLLIFVQYFSYSQLTWQNVDSLFQPLPSSIHVYFTNDKIDTGFFRAYYLIANIKDKHLIFTTDTTYKRRLTPTQFFKKNTEPLVVVNGTFFSFETNQNLNVVIKEGKLVSYTAPVKGIGKDSIHLFTSYKGAIGINKRRKADVAWIKTDSTKHYALAAQYPLTSSGNLFGINKPTSNKKNSSDNNLFSKWKMKTAIGGGPVLLQKGEIKVTNNEERMFAGKAINDKHPRTAMGYTKDNKLIILDIEGRNANAGGATLTQEAKIFKDLNAVEALNLDGGGSSCLLINGKETIMVSDKSQRAVPAVFLIQKKL
jgi:exopolysaccharide biosynthesis protein